MHLTGLLSLASTFDALLILAGLATVAILLTRAREGQIAPAASDAPHAEAESHHISAGALRRMAGWKAGLLLGLLAIVLGTGLHAWRSLAAEAESRRGTQTIAIRADLAWQNTGIVVKAGERVAISASGSWSNGLDAAEFGPGGNGRSDPTSEVPSAPAGALVGQIGDWARFTVGDGTTMTAEKTGWLWLSMNDRLNGHDDNHGAVTVLVTVQHQ